MKASWKALAIAALALLMGCVKSPDPADKNQAPMGSWVLVSQETRDSANNVLGRLDLSHRGCPHYAVITSDSIHTFTTATAAGPSALSHSECYVKLSDAYASADTSGYAPVSNRYSSFRVESGMLAVRSVANVIGSGQRIQVFSYQRLPEGQSIDLGGCDCAR